MSKSLTERIKRAMKRILPIGITTIYFTFFLSKPVITSSFNNIKNNKETINQESTFLFLDVDRFLLEFYKDNKKIAKFPVAVGKPYEESKPLSKPTPLGEYKIKKVTNWGGHYTGTWICFIETLWGGYGIHGFFAPWTVKYGNLTGFALTRGCIRLLPKDALYLRETIPVGTKIHIDYDTIEVDTKNKILHISSDFYSRGTNTLDNVIKKLVNTGIAQQSINKEKINEILKKVKEKTKTYIETAKKLDDLYTYYLNKEGDNYITDLPSKNPTIKNYLKILSENKEEIVHLEDIIKKKK